MTEPDDRSLEQNLRDVRDAISKTAESHGRDPEAVTLVAVSKTVPPERLQSAIDLGQTIFGENHVQEAKEKWPALRERRPEVRLHLVGGLQSNKARDAVSLFDVIQSVDRPSLAGALSRECERQGRRPSVFVQVNTGVEAQKSGVDPLEADRFIRECRDAYQLDLVGLMCIPPVDRDPTSDFALLRTIAERNGVEALSMGMSFDFAQAVAQGATHVRVGSAIFGARSWPQAPRA